MSRVCLPASTRLIVLSSRNFQPLLAVAPIIALTALLPHGPAWIAALAAIIVLGVPHGALDGEIARTLLLPRFGAAWFLVFALPYLALFAFVMLAWRAAPIGTLAAFLAGSVMHFGTEDAPSGTWLETLMRGGLPIAVPVLLHPVATASVLGGIAASPIDVVPNWLWMASWGWSCLAMVWVAGAFQSQTLARIVPTMLLFAVFVVLPPLTAFALYFVCVHAPAHTNRLICHPSRAPRVTGQARAFWLAVPITALTLLIGIGLWPLYSGAASSRLLSVTLQVLAALTLPHMVLDALVTALERRATAFLARESRQARGSQLTT